MVISGVSPDGRLVEMVELPDKRWFVATQAHPEYKARPTRPHPLFTAFVKAALDYENEMSLPVEPWRSGEVEAGGKAAAKTSGRKSKKADPELTSDNRADGS